MPTELSVLGPANLPELMGADVATLDHIVSLFHVLGSGAMGDMGKPLAASRLAILPASSHTAVIG